jgi:hypothetical protein
MYEIFFNLGHIVKKAILLTVSLVSILPPLFSNLVIAVPWPCGRKVLL